MALIGLKIETEAEGASFFDISNLVEFGKSSNLPVFVKIGGPDARNDIRECLSLGVDGLIAPMIESPFAVKKFHEASRDSRVSWRCLTIETITAFQNLESIASAAREYGIQGLTFGRGDFSDSVNRRGEEDSEEISAYVDQFTATCRDYGLVASVGGNMRKSSLRLLAKLGNSPDRLEGRRGIWEFSRDHLAMTDDHKNAIAIELEEVGTKKERLTESIKELDVRSQVLRERLKSS